MNKLLPSHAFPGDVASQGGVSWHGPGPRAIRMGSADAMKLTERAIAALDCPPGAKDRLVFDDAVPGLGLRISAAGARSFLVQYTTPARQRRRVPLGRWGAITLEQARTAARAILGDVARGFDPAQQRVQSRAAAVATAASARLTLAVLLEEWAAIGLAERRESYRSEALRALRYTFSRKLGAPASTLARADAVAALDALVRAGRVAIAGRTLAYGRACYGWALRRDMVETNPFDRLPIAAGTSSRDRVLSGPELRAVWRGLLNLSWPFGPLLRVLLLTAQRRDEVAGIRWSEISKDGAVWTIPQERAKNSRAHLVHLADQVRQVLTDLPRFVDKKGKTSDLVFTTTGKTAVSGFSRAKLVLNAAAAEHNQSEGCARALPPWRLHDFRRTAVTWMASNGIAPHVADRLLNHVTGTIGGVAAIYQRAEFLAERQAALDAWAAHLDGLV